MSKSITLRMMILLLIGYLGAMCVVKYAVADPDKVKIVSRFEVVGPNMKNPMFLRVTARTLRTRLTMASLKQTSFDTIGF